MIQKSKPKSKEHNELKEQQEGKKRLESFCGTYYELIESRMEDFHLVKDYLYNALEQLKKEGKIGSGVVILSRIKSPISVIENIKLGKNLNDIFGITLLTQNQKEEKEIKNQLSSDDKFNISSKKEMNAKRGYEAIHFLFDVEHDGEKRLNVECHLQTHEAYKNVYPHAFYKIRRFFERDLTLEEEECISNKIQQLYEKGELAGSITMGDKKSRLPQMWVATFNDKGKMEEMELDETQRLLIMYPFLDISVNKEER